jgi:hypothetical protein
MVATGAVVLVAALAVGWWVGLRPSNDRDWRPEVARLATAEINGDRVTVRNVRNFRYRAVEDFDQRWEERSYDLSRIEGLDVFFIDWGPKLYNHTILSWSFADGQRLAISVEVRKRRDQDYSAWKAFFRQYELIYVAADERDLIKLRTNHRREQVYLYRVRTTKAGARALLVNFLQAMNAIARKPLWYNALVANCTTVIRERVLNAGGRMPFAWQYVANAYLPQLLYRRGMIDTGRPFEELKAMSHINRRALQVAEGDDFSKRIRDGLPMPPLT